MSVLRLGLGAELDQTIYSNPGRQWRPPQCSPEKLCQQFMPLLVKNVHLISDTSYPGSFAAAGFCYAFVCVIKWLSPAAITSRHGDALNHNQITTSPAAGCLRVLPPQITGWHQHPQLLRTAPKASSPRLFPACQSSSSPAAADRTVPRSGRRRGLTGKRRMCACVCVSMGSAG